MKQIKTLYNKLLLLQGNYSPNGQFELDKLKTKLRIKETQYAGAAKLAEKALNGFENENAGKGFGGPQASAQTYLKHYYGDLFDKVAFDRDEYEILNGGNK